MATLQQAPVLSTPSDFAEPVIVQATSATAPSAEQIDLRYEIQRTVDEIRRHRWKRIALQFPDHMLTDAPFVYNRLRQKLVEARSIIGQEDIATTTGANDSQSDTTETQEERLIILGDTSYGACCVDEIAAEHAAADGVVHYGRSCLSPTQRLPSIYVYTSEKLDQDAVIKALETALPERQTKICLLADVPWQHHIKTMAQELQKAGYENVLSPELIHNPSSPIPNRELPQHLMNSPETLQQYTVFHIAAPPTSLVLTLSSRVKELLVYDPVSNSTSASDSAAPAVLRRRYASLLRISSAPVIGILINTLSVKNYMTALEHVQQQIAAAGKKSYCFVVGKLNPAKLANFAEVGGWVVIGCWESSLIDSKEFLTPIITPFELEVALMRDDSRIWGQEWISDFQTLLQRRQQKNETIAVAAEPKEAGDNWQDQSDDDEPPEFDLRTGRYVSHARPMRQHKAVKKADPEQPAMSSALALRSKGELASINGVVSPGAEYLRAKRDWKGLGSDFAIEYDRDEQGNIQGATMEQGRGGVARGYMHSEQDSHS